MASTRATYIGRFSIPLGGIFFDKSGCLLVTPGGVLRQVPGGFKTEALTPSDCDKILRNLFSPIIKVTPSILDRLMKRLGPGNGKYFLHSLNCSFRFGSVSQTNRQGVCIDKFNESRYPGSGSLKDVFVFARDRTNPWFFAEDSEEQVMTPKNLTLGFLENDFLTSHEVMTSFVLALVEDKWEKEFALMREIEEAREKMKALETELEHAVMGGKAP
jgi:hypothetical protein